MTGSIYNEWGFRNTPFSTTALEPTELGRKLLVGRDNEVRQLLARLKNAPKLPTLEGSNGVGKTSLVNVTTYEAMQQHRSSLGPLFVACRRAFQLKPDAKADDFVREVFVEIGHTLVEFSNLGLTPGAVNTEQIERCLTSPHSDATTARLKQLIAGGRGAHVDDIVALVRAWLRDTFSSHGDGGVVCIIDNIELLQTSDAARQLIEQLRDLVLTQPGIRWVLCGAAGIVRSVVASPRMEGLLHSPMELKGVDDRHASSILPSRQNAYAERPDAYLPILADDFERLYRIVHGNLRFALGDADNFCMWIAERELPQTDAERRTAFQNWLRGETEAKLQSVEDKIPPRTMTVFKKAIEIGGEFSPSDFESFGFRSSQTMRPHVKALEDLGLLISLQDDTDRRRKTVSITPKGWYVDYGFGLRERPA